MHNAGVPAWSSANFEPCVDSIVPQDADFVVVEFAINDHEMDVSHACLDERAWYCHAICPTPLICRIATHYPPSLHPVCSGGPMSSFCAACSGCRPILR